jgi:serine/threonine-protein phosphatase PP1 catalytic subunit
VLLGNHEWSHLTLRPVYKSGIDQRIDFEEKVRKTFSNKLIRDRFANKWQRKMGEYRNFFESLPIAVKTDNKVFISHAGPSNHIKSLHDVINITDNGYNNLKLDDLLWKRYSDFTEEELNQFMKNLGCNVHIVGHTIVDGIKIVGKRQLIVSSSDSLKPETSLNSNSDYYLTGHDIYVPGRKAYVMLDLEAEIEDVEDVLGMLRYL